MIRSIKVLIFFGDVEKDLKMQDVDEHLEVQKNVVDEMLAEMKMLDQNRILEIILAGFGQKSKECGVCEKSIHPKKLVVGKLKDFIGVDFCYMQTSAPLLFICDDNECAIQGLFGVREKIEEFLVNNSAGRFCDFCQERCENCTGAPRVLHQGVLRGGLQGPGLPVGPQGNMWQGGKGGFEEKEERGRKGAERKY